MPYVGGSLTTFFDEQARAFTAKAAHNMADAGGDSILAITAMNTPVRTGALRASWHKKPAAPDASMEGGTGWRTTVSTDLSYAAYVEYGTGLYGPKHAPYVIKPKNPGGTLRFIAKDGGVVFAKSVLHPGSPGNYMLAIGMDVTQGLVESGELFKAELEAWVGEVEGLAK
jgi:hypothetical protein